MCQQVTREWGKFFLETTDSAEKKILEEIQKNHNETLLFGEFLTLAPVLFEGAAKKCYQVYGEVVMDSSSSDGLLAISWFHHDKEKYSKNLFIYEEYDIELCKKMLRLVYTTE